MSTNIKSAHKTGGPELGGGKEENFKILSRPVPKKFMFYLQSVLLKKKKTRKTHLKNLLTILNKNRCGLYAETFTWIGKDTLREKGPENRFTEIKGKT